MSLKNNFDFPKMTEEERIEAFSKAFYGPKNHFVDMPDRFVLEDDITHQSDISDQLNLLIENIIDDPDSIDPDDITNTLMGIIAVHDLRTNKLWQHFKMIYELDEYSPKSSCKSGSCSYNENIDPDTWMKYQR